MHEERKEGGYSDAPGKLTSAIYPQENMIRSCACYRGVDLDRRNRLCVLADVRLQSLDLQATLTGTTTAL